MPFDNPPPTPRPERRRRIRLPKSTLKAVIVDAALSGLISTRDAEDLIAEYGLRGE